MLAVITSLNDQISNAQAYSYSLLGLAVAVGVVFWLVHKI